MKFKLTPKLSDLLENKRIEVLGNKDRIMFGSDYIINRSGIIITKDKIEKAIELGIMEEVNNEI